MDFGVSKRFITLAIGVLVFIYVFTLTSREHMVQHFSETTRYILSSKTDGNVDTAFRIKDKVALITDTQYSERLIPLILHYHAVLGPDWPIVFYTSEEIINNHLKPEAQNASGIWRQLLERGQVETRVVPDGYNWRNRSDINRYLSRPWIWEQLAPAKHVLLFQTDAILCSNSHHTIDDFLGWDFIGAPLHRTWHIYNGGLSLRNRTMMLEILNEGNSWEEEITIGNFTEGEDVWFSDKMYLRGGHVPSWQEAVHFACQHTWHIDEERAPFGYHKVHKSASMKLDEISEYCPEIALTAPGNLPKRLR